MKLRPALLLLLVACGEREESASEPPEVTQWIEATREGVEERQRRLACLELGRVGGERARDRLLELLSAPARNPAVDGPLHLYAAAGLTILADPGTAIDLIENLSTVNSNDSLAALASEERDGEYYPIDAQLCEALLAMGLWNAEEELVAQMRRRDRIRVLIDAHAVLRRRTGLALPFRYNGSYADRNADADRWQAELRRTREERRRKRPFDASAPRFRRRLAEVVSWLGGRNVRLRLKAHKILPIVGEPAVSPLLEALRSAGRVAQRQAASVLGEMRVHEAAGVLREALALPDADARAEAVDALRKIGDAGAPVRPLLEDPDPEVRAAAARFVAEHPAAGDPELLRARLEAEAAPATRTWILCALLAQGDHSVVPALISVFLEGEQLDRAAALAALERVAGKRSPAGASASREERERAAATITDWFRDG